MGAQNTISATFYDYDRDADLDLFLGHWGVARGPGDNPETLWRNNGDVTFGDAAVEAGLAHRDLARGQDPSSTPSFSDIDNDGDLLLTADFGTSQVFLNNGDGTFGDVTDRDVIVDQAGMGSALGDYDRDGDLDWFVTSIHTLDGRNLGKPSFGNRLYRNIVSGLFEDVTLAAGVADGGRGWGGCFADFGNDATLDIFPVNGWTPNRGHRLHHGSGSVLPWPRGRHVRRTRRGGGPRRHRAGPRRRLFDADGNGDPDILIVNSSEPYVAYGGNVVDNGNRFLTVRLGSDTGNRLALARGLP